MSDLFLFFRKLFATDFMPHVYCLREPSLVALHAVSDAAIAVSYFLIPMALIMLVRRRRDLTFRWAFVLFGVFIFVCGASHLMAVITLWHPWYRFEGLVKAITALVSVPTALLLFRLLPQAVAIPSPERLRQEIEERRRAEERVRSLNAELESRVRERTLQLEESEARLVAILDGYPAIVCVRDLAGRYSFVNRAFERAFDVTRGEIEGRTPAEVFPGESGDWRFADDTAALAEGPVESEEESAAGPLGLRSTLSVRFPLRDRHGETYAVCRIATDITERKRMQAGLAAAGRKLAELAVMLDKTQAMVCDLDGAVVYWTSGASSFYGWPPEEAISRTSHELLQTEFPQPIAEIEAELIAHGSWAGELQQRRRDGAVVWVASHWALHRAADSAAESVVIVNNDITQLKHAEDALRASEETVRSLFENASQGILTVNREGRIVNANLMLKGLFGYRRGELIGRSVECLLPDHLRPLHEGHRADYVANPHTRPMGQGMDLVGLRKDGSEFPVEVSLSFIAAQGGLAMAFVSDITARKRANEEREDLIARLETALSEKTVLLKEVHHRVKNNLAVIAGLLGMQADALENERAVMALTESQQRVQSMALIHEHLYATDHLDRVDFAEYARQLATELCSSFAVDEERVEVRVDAAPIELGVYLAIPCGLILNELLSNALKYAFPDGRTGQIVVHFAETASGALALSCRDNGVGIPEGFDWENSRSLGLKIVRILTRQIDGNLRLYREGPGACFELAFPGERHE